MSRQKEYAKTDLSFDDLLRASMGVPIKGERKKRKGKKASREKQVLSPSANSDDE